MPPRISRRTRLTVTLSVTAAVLFSTGYAAAVATAPLPAPVVAASNASAAQIAADPEPAQAVVDAQLLPTAIGWLDGDTSWSNDATAYPLASISKLVTVLVCQEKEPLGVGESGATHVWTEQDHQRQEDFLADGGVAYPIPVGTEVTVRDMLTLIFLPSANDFATAYAYSVFGDNDTFIAAVNEWKDRHKLTSLTFVEPSGMNEANTASAADLITIARLVLNNPTLAEFTSTPEASMPWGIGEIHNTNPLLGVEPNIVGVKTGRSSSAGFNFIAARKRALGDRDIIDISVTLGRGSLEERAESGREMLAEMHALATEVSAVTADEIVATATSTDGQRIPLVAAEPLTATLLPGEHVQRTVRLDATLPSHIALGDRLGTLEVATPAGTKSVPILAGAEVIAPGFWWRATHPFALFAR